jgi:hypothetical protein
MAKSIFTTSHKMRILKNFIYTAAVTLCFLSCVGQKANAGQLYNGWNYSIDAFKDGSGGAVYDIKGIAIKESGDKVYVALTGGMPLNGTMQDSVHIGWGDLFFNFSGQNFQTASQTGQLFAVKFADYDGSLSTGVYQKVTAKSVTAEHSGYTSLKAYYNAGFYKSNTQGTDLATLQQVYNYYYPTAIAQNPTTNNTPILNVIASGTKVGNISLLGANELTAAGLDFGHFSAAGSQTIGFAFDKALIGTGSYIASIYLECGNDGVAIKGEIKSTPEPTATAGLVIFTVGFGAVQIRKRQKGVLA